LGIGVATAVTASVFVTMAVAVTTLVNCTTMVGVGVNGNGVTVTFVAAADPDALSGVNWAVSVIMAVATAFDVWVDCTTLLTKAVLVITCVINCCSMTAVLVETCTLVTTWVPVIRFVEVMTDTLAVPLDTAPAVMPAD